MGARRVVDQGNDKKGQSKKNREPRERSSKIPPPIVRQIIPLSQLKPERRDPRFERSSGEFNQGLFEKSYGFVHDYQERELSILKKQIKERSDPNLTALLKEEARSLNDRIKTWKNRERRIGLRRQWKKSEKALVRMGKKPFYLKNSDLKKLELVERYKELSERGPTAVKKYIENKSRKRACSSRKHIPKVAPST